VTNPFNLEAQAGENIWITGDMAQIKASAAQTQGAYTMIEAFASPGNGPPPHLHRNEDETLYVLDCEFEILNGEQHTRAKPDALAFSHEEQYTGFAGSGRPLVVSCSYIHQAVSRILPGSRESGCRRWPSTTSGLG
jgi:hypothetical protein